MAVPEPSAVPKIWLPVSGFSAYAAQFPVKNGVKPCGCGNTVKKLSQPTCCPRASGIATWTKWPVQAKELTPNKPDKWWFKRDSAFLNQLNPG